jgi:predicted ester cyclase
MKPTGKPMKMTWIDYITVKNGKMQEHWGYGDMEAMMKAYQKPMAPAHK